MAEIPEEIIDQAVARYRDEKANCLQTIHSIEVEGWRFYKAHGEEEMHDVTAERLAKQKDIVVQMDALIVAYENLRA